MHYDDLNQIPPAIERIIVINVSTEAVSAVAIASALRNAGMPLLVVNCTPAGPNRRLMDELANQWNFDLIDLQLSPHGITLDRLFERLHSDRLLLLDSDAEIRSPLVTARMRHALSNPAAYGSGWVHDADWLGPEKTGAPGPVVYRERPWIPCAMFRVSYVRAALNAGGSFNENYIVGSAIRNLNLPPQYLANGLPMAVHNDTGAEIHAWAVETGLHFAGPSVHSIDDEVAHHHGVTRSVLVPGGENASQFTDVRDGAIERLRSAYPEMWNGFSQAAAIAQTVVF